MATYIVRQAFLTFTVGQVVYSDADATGKPAASVILDAQVAGHSAALVTVSSSTAPVSTTGTGTSSTGTTTTATGTGTTTTTGPVVTSFVRNADGSTTFTSSDGSMLTVAATSSLTAAQAATLAAVGSVVNSAGQVTASVIGDVSNASAAGTTVAAAISTLGSHTAHLLSLDTGLSAINQAESTVGTTVAAHTALLGTHTAQLGTLATGVSASGSAASAAGTIAMAAQSTAAAAQSAAGSATAAVGNLGTQVAAIKPINGSSVLGTTSAGAINYALTSTVNGTTSTSATLTIPPGTLGAGSIGGNVVASAVGGPDVALSTFFSRARSSDHFGTLNANVTLQSALGGVTTRAAVAAWKNSAGFAPYPFFATYPVSTGNDIQVFAAVATTSGSTLNLATTLTLPAAASGYTGPTGLYTGVDGYSYLYTNNNPGMVYTAGQYVTDATGKLAANTQVIATFNNCIRITTQASSVAVAAGVVVTIGAQMSQISVGQQIWAAQGIAPLTTITAISGTTITLSNPLVSGGSTTTSYGVAVNGVFALSTMFIFTPVAENQICSTMTIDWLAIAAGYMNSRKDDQSLDLLTLSRGDHIISAPLYLWGKHCSIVGMGEQNTYLRTTYSANGFAVMILMQAETSIYRTGGFSFDHFNGTQLAGLYVDGSGETVPSMNDSRVVNGAETSDIKISVDLFDMTSTSGCQQTVRLRHIGGVHVKRVSGQGSGDTLAAYPTCAVHLANVVYCIMTNISMAIGYAAILVEGYTEHLKVIDPADITCTTFFDSDAASVLPTTSVGCLIFEVQGTDIDWQYFGFRVAFAQSVVITGSEIQGGNPAGFLPNRTTAPIISLEACQYGVVSNLVGGAGSTSVDAIQLKNRSLDGASYGTNGILFSNLVMNGMGSAIRCDAGCNGNFFDDRSIFLNGSTSGAIVDKGTNTHLLATAASLATDTYVNAYFSGSTQAVAAGSVANASGGVGLLLNVDTDPGSNVTGNGTAGFAYTAKRSGHYEFTVRVDFANAGSAGAYPVGTRLGVSVGAASTNMPIRAKTADAYSNTVEFTVSFYIAAEQAIPLYAYADAATTITYAHVTAREIVAM